MAVAYIIDDEEHAALLLKDKLMNITDFFDTIEIFTKPMLAFQAIIKQRPDLIFSDVEMPLIKGVDFHQEIANFNIPFIYVTAYSSYSLKAIKLQAFDYLLKPVKEDELQETVERFIKHAEAQLQKDHQHLSFAELLNKQKDKITVSTSDSIFFIPIESIIKIDAINNYSNIFLNDKSTLVASKTLKHFETQLTSFGFVRAHKSYLVNLIYIERLLNKDGGQILLKNGETIDVTREKRIEIKDWFKL